MMLPALALASILSLPSAPALQTVPDFSGTWIEDLSQRTITETPAGAEGPRSMTGPSTDLVVRQTPETLTREYPPFMSRVVRYVYQLDGKESVNQNGAETQTTRSRWEGSKLVSRGTLYSVTSLGESSSQVFETQWLNAKRS